MRRLRVTSLVALIGLLALMVIRWWIGNPARTEDARVSKALSDISGIVTMLEAFKLDMRRYPTGEEGLVILRDRPNSQDANLWKGPYSRKPIPSDPWGRPYLYVPSIPVKPGEIGVKSLGADGFLGGDGYNKDINSWSNYDEQQSQEQGQ